MKAEKEKCAICGEYHFLAKHIRMHNISSEDYYRKYLMKPGEGLCKTCGAPTKFCGLTEKRFAPYCSNKCHNNDKEYLFIRSLNRKNKTPEEKAATRAKQIAAWEKSMGLDWAKQMAHHSFKTYKERTGYYTPWDNPEVRKKCEDTWGYKSPGQILEVKKVLSEKATIQMRAVHEQCIKRELDHIQKLCKDIIDYDGSHWKYKCPTCGTITERAAKAINSAIKMKNFTYLCGKCHCMPSHSLKEKEMYTYIKSVYDGKIIEGDREQLNGKEIDVYLPDLKLGFEFDGSYWHGDVRFNKPDDIICFNTPAKDIWESDKNKDKLCESLGIKLIRIKEYDWDTDIINTKHLISEVIKDVKRKYK